MIHKVVIAACRKPRCVQPQSDIICGINAQLATPGLNPSKVSGLLGLFISIDLLLRRHRHGLGLGIAGDVRLRSQISAQRHQFRLGRNAGETQSLQGWGINNGVDSMTIILRFIYREYCRTCLMHCRYL